MRYRLTLGVIALCLGAPLLAGATTVLPLDLRQLTDKASVIAYGRVVAAIPQWATDRNGIDTMVTIQVTHYLKGDFGAQVTFRVAGGKIGRFRAVTVGAPVFREGEEVIVFLGAAGPAIPRIVGFNQGVYRVNADPATGARAVTAPLMSEVSTPTPIVRGDPSRKPVPLAQFEARVRSMMQDRAVDPGRERGRVNNRRVIR